jgi:hypothetical protein
MQYKDLKIERKEVLKIIREQLNVSQYGAYSEPRKDHQRVKWFGCTTSVEAIKEVLAIFNYKDVVVESHIGNGYFRSVESVILRFPYSSYK